jgi:hypothetical protein
VRVLASRELRRIAALPRRDSPQLLAELTEALRLPHGEQTLRAAQTLALVEAYELGGLFGGLGVGEGKTLLTRLLPVLFGAQRAVLLTLANLLPATETKFAEIDKHWASCPMLVVSYEWLRHKNRHSWLQTYASDLLILDEGHAIKNPRATTTKRVIAARKADPRLPIIVLTGTPSERSIFDAHVGMRLALGDERCPLPVHYPDVEVWRAALDEDALVRAAPGALELLGPCGSLAETRATVGRRIRETPGVILSSDTTVAASLLIDDCRAELSREAEQGLRDLRTYWRLPDGTELFEILDTSRHVFEIALDFFYRWEPEPTKEWRARRSECAQWMRHRLQTNRSGVDSWSVGASWLWWG